MTEQWNHRISSKITLAAVLMLALLLTGSQGLPPSPAADRNVRPDTDFRRAAQPLRATGCPLHGAGRHRPQHRGQGGFGHDRKSGRHLLLHI